MYAHVMPEMPKDCATAYLRRTALIDSLLTTRLALGHYLALLESRLQEEPLI
jgi:hypothetical protein